MVASSPRRKIATNDAVQTVLVNCIEDVQPLLRRSARNTHKNAPANKTDRVIAQLLETDSFLIDQC